MRVVTNGNSECIYGREYSYSVLNDNLRFMKERNKEFREVDGCISIGTKT